MYVHQSCKLLSKASKTGTCAVVSACVNTALGFFIHKKKTNCCLLHWIKAVAKVCAKFLQFCAFFLFSLKKQMPFSLLCLLFVLLMQQNCPCQAQTSIGINNSFTDEWPFDDWSNATGINNTDNGFYYHGPFGRNGPTLSRSFVIDTSLISSTYSYILTLSYQVLLGCNIEGSDRVHIGINVDGNSKSNETSAGKMTFTFDNPFAVCTGNTATKIGRSGLLNQSVILYGNNIINNNSDDIEISIYGSFSDTITKEFWMIGQILLSIESQSASPTKIPTDRPSVSPTFLPTSSPIFYTIDGNQDTVFCDSNWTNCTILCKSLVTKKNFFCVFYCLFCFVCFFLSVLPSLI